MTRETTRTHDKLYLDENRKLHPKEYFKFIAKYARPFLSGLENPTLLDVGCATGDFLHYAGIEFPWASLIGMDVMGSLIDRAKEEVPKAEFYLGDIYQGLNLPDKKFDAIFMSGVHTIFEEFKPWVNNLVSLLSKQGRGYVFGLFNPFDLDIVVHVRRSGADGPAEMGWNTISKKSIQIYLQELGFNCRFMDWEINIDISAHPEDPLRSWTIRTQEGARLVVNGTQVLHQFSLLEICKENT
jgi:SAM-dependent methyltransferase